MCRFTLYLGDDLRLSQLLTEPENSVVNQSFHAEEGELPFNGDGFGIAWYVPRMQAEPAAFRDLTPAWSNRNLAHLARVLESGCILAHVRAATPGHLVSQQNCHPFVCGPYAFMHNGDLAGFHEVKKRLVEGLSEDSYRVVHGSTDSEHLFAMFLDRLGRAPGEGTERILAALEATIEDSLALVAAVTDRPSFLNLAVSDGENAVVTRAVSAPGAPARSLYVHTGKRYVCDETHCWMEATEGGCATLISSEPLDGDDGWEPVPENHAVLARRGERAEVRALRMPATAGRAG